MELRRPRHRGQRGLTLPELLVSIVILSIIAGALGEAFNIGLRTLGNAAATSELVGSHDLVALEEFISGDIARASCLAAPLQTTVPSGVTPTPCANSVAKSPSTCDPTYGAWSTSNPQGYFLCSAWYDGASGGGTQVTYPSASTLTDASAAWTTNQWAGSVVTVTLSNGNQHVTATVASNTGTTLTVVGHWSTNPSAGNSYVLNTGCRTAWYWEQSPTVDNTGALWRSEYNATTGTTSTQRLTTGAFALDVVPKSGSPTPGVSWTAVQTTVAPKYAWANFVTIVATQQLAAKATYTAATTTFYAVPQNADPLSSAAPGGVQSPC